MDPETGAMVVELRNKGPTPKAIARRLALRPADVAPLIRDLAARPQGRRPAGEFTSSAGCLLHQPGLERRSGPSR